MGEDLIFALERLADESRPVRSTNLAALSDVPRIQAEAFRAAWNGFSSERRLELVRELVEQAEDNIHLNFCAILRELLHDADEQVRKLAIEGLWEDNRPALVAPLVGLVRDDPSAEVRAAAAMALGRFVLLGALGEIAESLATRAEEALRAAWARPQEVTEVRRRALEGLAYTNDSDVRELIRVAYYDEDRLLRQSALFAMGRSADTRWSKYVIAELKSQEAAMRFEAAVAAGELTLAGAVPPLIQLLEDPDSSVREAAATSLGQIGGPAAKRALEAAASGPEEGLALAAESALEELTFNSGSLGDDLFAFRAPQNGVGTASGVDDEDLDAYSEAPDDDLMGEYDDSFEEDELDELDDYGDDAVDWWDEDEDREED